MRAGQKVQVVATGQTGRILKSAGGSDWIVKVGNNTFAVPEKQLRALEAPAAKEIPNVVTKGGSGGLTPDPSGDSTTTEPGDGEGAGDGEGTAPEGEAGEGSDDGGQADGEAGDGETPPDGDEDPETTTGG